MQNIQDCLHSISCKIEKYKNMNISVLGFFFLILDFHRKTYSRKRFEVYKLNKSLKKFKSLICQMENGTYMY